MKILCILGHPNKDSLCGSLQDHYVLGAKSAGHEVEEILLSDLKFDPILHKGYKKIQELEEDLKISQEKITWADHVVFTYPLWWGTYPALLKGFIDRVFLPGFAFKYREHSPLPDKLLKGKTSRVIVTTDTPQFFLKTFLGNAGIKSMKQSVLEFVGFEFRETIIGPVKGMNEKKIKKTLQNVYEMGQKGI